MPEPPRAQKQDNIMSEEPTNGRIPVLQRELQYINDSIRDLSAVFRDHCKQDEETRKNQALVMQEQAAQRAALVAATEALALKADAKDMAELKSMIKNPWVIALGSGGTVGLILQLAPILKQVLGGP